jgi:hypothetical protein
VKKKVICAICKLPPNSDLSITLYSQCKLCVYEWNISSFFHFKVVSIDLMDLSSNPDSKKYERVSWSFKEKKPLKFDFLLAWHRTGMKDK